jgi:hypothetical protein
MNNRFNDPYSKSRRLFVDPTSVILFDVEIELHGDLQSLPQSGEQIRQLWDHAPLNGTLPGVTHSRLTGCELVDDSESSRTFSVGFASIAGTGKGAGHSVPDATIRRKLKDGLESALPRWRPNRLGNLSHVVVVRNVLRLPFSSRFASMERMLTAGYRLAEVAHGPAGWVVSPDGSGELLDRTAADLTPMLEFKERRSPFRLA